MEEGKMGGKMEKWCQFELAPFFHFLGGNNMN